MSIKSVDDGFAPYEVLYDVATKQPELLQTHIGELIQVKWTRKERLLFYVNVMKAYTKRANAFIHGRKVVLGDKNEYLNELPTIILGGELLTRCRDKYLPRKYIGDAFRKMPKEMMADVSAIILKQQLKEIRSFPKNKRYSVNIENVYGYKNAWENTLSAISQYATERVILELIEDSMFSPRALNDINDVCCETGAGIYLDDLCSLCHALPDSQEYIVMLIEKLHKHIRAVKIDYSVMQNILIDINAANEVGNNLRSFRWLWIAHCNYPVPAVIFESMPKKDINWLRELELFARGYKSCYYQLG